MAIAAAYPWTVGYNIEKPVDVAVVEGVRTAFVDVVEFHLEHVVWRQERRKDAAGVNGALEREAREESVAT